MRFRDRLKTSSGDRSIAASIFLPGLFVVLLSLNVEAQTAPTSTPQSAAKSSAPVATLLTPADSWPSLSKAQKAALAPLEDAWSGLSAGSRQKWLEIAKTYPGLGPLEQEKLHSRMAEWAALSPKDRAVARFNFAQSKTVNKSDRAANWEAYQALSPDERQKLAQGAKMKPVGAAVAIKPVAPEKLTAVPVTRHTPEQERATAVQQRQINRNTLLPLPASSATATPVAAPAKP